MKKYLLFIGFLLTSFVSFSQVIPKPNPTAVGIGYKRLLADSTIFIPTGGAIPRLGSNNINRRSAIYADTINKKLWVFYPNDSTWKESGLTKINWDSVFNKPIYFKTKYDSSTDIKDSILARLAIRDTAAMLAPYVRTGALTDYVPNTRSLTINGVAQNLSTDRTWSIAPGGVSGQILSKNSNTDYDYGWIDNFADWTSTVKEYVKVGQDITKGQAVYVSSSDGTNIIVSKASNATEATSSKVIGLLAQTLSTNGKGYVITEGLLSGLNTASATTGDPVWLGVDGNLIYGLTNKPYAPAHLVYIGVVVRSNSSNGEIFIQPQNGFELRELHDVSAQSPSNNDGLFYNSSNSLWQTKSIATVLGYTPANAATYLPLSGGTMTGNLLLPANNNAGGTNFYIGQIVANNDYWRIYGNTLGSDRSEMVFHVGDNAQPSSTTGQRFRFFYDNANDGTAKDVLIVDYNESIFNTNLTATSFIKSGGTSSQFLKADGTIDANAYLRLSGGTLTGALLGTTANFTQSLSTITAGTSIDGTISYTPSTNINNVNSYNIISRYKLNLTNGTYNSSTGQENATAIFAFLNVDGNNGSISTQPLRGVTAGFSVATAAIKIADYRAFQVSSLESLGITGNTVTNAYGLYIQQLKGSTNFTVTNGYGIYQAGTSDINFFAGALNGASSTFSGSISLGNNNVFPSGAGIFQGSNTLQIVSGTSGLAVNNNANTVSNFVITNSGNVAIGNTVASELLDIRGANRDETSAQFNQIIYSTSSQDLGVGASIGFGGATSGTGSLTAFGAIKGIKENGNGGNTAGALLFLTRENAGPILEKMRITSGGNLVIGGGTSNTGQRLQCYGQFASLGGQAAIYTQARDLTSNYAFYASNSTALLLFNSGIGNIGQFATATGIYTPLSDINKKKDFEESTIGLKEVLQLKPTLYRMKSENDFSPKELGFIAQEVKEFIPQAYVESKGDDKFIGLNYNAIVAALVKSVQEQQAQIEILKTEMQILKNKQ